MEEFFVWVTTRRIKDGALEDLRRAWEPPEFPAGMQRAFEWVADDGRTIVGVSHWESKDSCERYRSSDVAFFQTGGMVFALWSRDELAADSAVDDGGSWGGVTLAHNVDSPEDVERVVAEAERAGATIARPPGPTFWGGYSGVFVDPDGHPWEVAHNPDWSLAEDGSIRL